jgi:hypothetical protein
MTTYDNTNPLQDHFPKVSADCKPQAQTFFTCFSTGSVKLNNDDKDAGIRGIHSCLAEKNAYDKCMFGWEKKVPSKRYRVRISILSLTFDDKSYGHRV